MKYSIIDIETTGGNFKNGKITEIAIYVHDGKNVIDEFVSLINPEQFIPPYITQLTGISNEMVVSAPKFYEIAKRIVEITEGSVFVAHNASFDYGFIQEEFRALGYEFKRDTLCTVKLSRKLLPGYSSYSLGNLCVHLNINNNARHRAAGDALATVTLFEILLSKNHGVIMPLDGNKYFTAESLHPELSMECIESLPEAVGVYYFYNENKDLIYIGKSKCIKKRVLTHLGTVKAQKAVRMKSEVASVDYYITGSELVALLKESAEIKKHKPKYNQAQKKSKVNVGLYSFKDRKGYIRFNILKNDGRTTPLNSFETLKEAKVFLANQAERYVLCQKLCGLSDSVGSCFQYQIKMCKGACVDQESPELYNIRARKFIDSMVFSQSDCVIKDVGRNEDENAVIAIRNGKYMGYGWVDKYQTINSMDQILDFVSAKDDTMDARLIIKRQIQENKSLKIIGLTEEQ
ncbi:exonuclease domain-containing protein [Plebeiibacterium sediminum]|uniref:Exonuclease domain-containing protein n=1 Tax=Plebeiibacterium sediminum TaxID=2992112 RepID=A0AAE3M560_9BACT|nr:exonuclease domain-containing protein [Plebeiobacterium sediminum]MCW3787032.1 exonuclease domain-containing protein [Plebeiobacterium sediminum]